MTLTQIISDMFNKTASSPAQRAVNAGAPNADASPTEAQKSVGNYQKVHLSIDGFRISIENPKGSIRSGTAPDGTKWSNTLACDYGDIRGTKGPDGDPVDVYLSDHPEKGAVFVIDQIDPKTKKFDEHKVMYGFDSVEEAKKAYLACYQKGWGGLGWITPVTKAEFRKWVDSSTRKTKPFHEYASVTPIVNPIKVKATEAAPSDDDAEHPIILNGYEFDSPTNIMAKQAQSISGYTGFSTSPNNPLLQLGASMRGEEIDPDADTRHFFDTIVPYIKSHSETAGKPDVDYDASKFAPGFYRSVSIRKKPLGGNAGVSNWLLGVRIDPEYVNNSSTLVHELKHQQNQDGFPFSSIGLKQSGRSAADDRLLSNTYNFAKDDVRQYYPLAFGYELERHIKAEQGATHAEHQFAIMRELKEKLGRYPTGEEFVDYVRTADDDTLNAWREYVPNAYQHHADARNLRPTPTYYEAYSAAEEEAKKLDFPKWIDYAPKSEMDKYKQQPWYDPDIFRRSSVDGDPFDETTESGISGGFNPMYKWIEGRSQQKMIQPRKPALESFRRALLNVAKNKVLPGKIYQNAQNTMRGMLV